MSKDKFGRLEPLLLQSLNHCYYFADCKSFRH